jgi:hypothetical protein
MQWVGHWMDGHGLLSMAGLTMVWASHGLDWPWARMAICWSGRGLSYTLAWSWGRLGWARSVLDFICFGHGCVFPAHGKPRPWPASPDGEPIPWPAQPISAQHMTGPAQPSPFPAEPMYTRAHDQTNTYTVQHDQACPLPVRPMAISDR